MDVFGLKALREASGVNYAVTVKAGKYRLVQVIDRGRGKASDVNPLTDPLPAGAIRQAIENLTAHYAK